MILKNRTRLPAVIFVKTNTRGYVGSVSLSNGKSAETTENASQDTATRTDCRREYDLFSLPCIAYIVSFIHSVYNYGVHTYMISDDSRVQELFGTHVHYAVRFSLFIW